MLIGAVADGMGPDLGDRNQVVGTEGGLLHQNWPRSCGKRLRAAKRDAALRRPACEGNQQGLSPPR